MLRGIGLALQRGACGFRCQQGVADEFRVDPTLAIEGFLEREDDQHLRDTLLDPAKAAALPGPKLWRDEPDDRNAGAVQMAGKPEVDVREIDEDRDRGALAAYGPDEAAVARVDLRDVAEDLGDTHDGDVFGPHHLLLVLPSHLRAPEPGEGGVGKAAA